MVAILSMCGIAPATPVQAGDPEVIRIQRDVPVTPTDLRSLEANNSPQLAVDPTEPSFVVLANRLDSPFSCRLSVSGDRGRTWLPASPILTLPSGSDTCYGPEVDFDADGRLYYLFVGLHGKANAPMGAFLVTSSDRGRSFSAPRQLLGGERYMVRMAMDRGYGRQGRLHLVWLEPRSMPPPGGLGPPPNPLMASFSDDGGATFSSPQRVSDPERQLVVAPALSLGPDNSLHIAYYDLGDDVRDYEGLEGPTWNGRWSLIETSSFDGGEHYERGVVVDRDIVPPTRVMLIYTMPPPALVADRGGRVLAAWTDSRHGAWDVLRRRSVDGGRTWQPVERLSDDTAGTGRYRYLPALAVAPNGRIDAIFYDRRLDPDNLLHDVYYTYSTDAGENFSPNLKLTDRPSDSRIGATYPFIPSAAGLVELGSRLGLASDDSAVVAAWPDSRHDVAGAQQDIAATEVDLPETGDRSRRWRGVFVALLALGLLLAASIAARVLRQRRRVGR